jgi:hypothetical protein
MTMDETEICNSYTNAQDKRKQRGVLADLNVCSRQEIDQILQKHGLLEPEPKRRVPNRKIDNEKAYELHQAGRTDKEIAEAFGSSIASVERWRDRNGLPKNQEPLEEPVLREKDARGKTQKPMNAPEAMVVHQGSACKTSETRKEGKGVTVEIYFPDGVVPCQIRILGGAHGEL